MFVSCFIVDFLVEVGFVYQILIIQSVDFGCNVLFVVFWFKFKVVNDLNVFIELGCWIMVVVVLWLSFYVGVFYVFNQVIGCKFEFYVCVFDVIKKYGKKWFIIMGDINFGCIGIDE